MMIVVTPKQLGEMLNYHATIAEVLVGIIFFIALYIVYAVSSAPKFQWIPEACVIMMMGLVGAIIGYHVWHMEIITFDSGIFFILLLPIIIFNSGIEVNSEAFYQNFLAIMVFANLGTIINAIVVALLIYNFGESTFCTSITLPEAISFGALISATDPVTTIAVFERLQVEHHLYAIVVGVSVLDDAVSVIIFDLINAYLQSGVLTADSLLLALLSFTYKFIGSVGFGYFNGFLFAYFLKSHRNLLTDRPSLALTLSVLIVYLIYWTADVCLLSGIITTMFAGITFRTYFEIYDATAYQQVRSIMNHVAVALEGLTFLYMGWTFPAYSLQGMSDWSFMLASIVFGLVGRIVQIYPLSFALNLYNHVTPANSQAYLESLEDTASSHSSHPTHTLLQGATTPSMSVSSRTASYPPYGITLSLGQQHMMLFAGLRGPIAYATAQLFDNTELHTALIVSTTAWTVMLTTFLLGALTFPALQWFGIEYSGGHTGSTTTTAATTGNNTVGDGETRPVIDITNPKKWVVYQRHAHLRVSSSNHDTNSNGNSDTGNTNSSNSNTSSSDLRNQQRLSPISSSTPFEESPLSACCCFTAWVTNFHDWEERMLLTYFLSAVDPTHPTTNTTTGYSTVQLHDEESVHQPEEMKYSLRVGDEEEEGGIELSTR